MGRDGPDARLRRGVSTTADDAARRKEALALRARLRTIATTGTNGKTSTTARIAAIVAAAGEPEALFTTVDAIVAGQPVVGPPSGRRDGSLFIATLEAAGAAGVKTLALEMTSLALARGGAERWPADVAVFTNLTRDHLDYHPSPEAYLAAKAQLFIHVRPPGVAVLNRDDPSSALLREVTRAARVLDYSLVDREADLAAARVEVALGRTRVVLAGSRLADALGGELLLRTTGRVHVANALAAALACHAAGYDAAAIALGLEAFVGVPGRFEPVSGPGGPAVVVDYAHTPDGLGHTVATARELLADDGGRLILVFGCGGERDRGKRPEMAKVADLADVVFLTTDNPRREAPEAIAAEVLAGVPAPAARWTVEHDRRAAIAEAIGIAKAGWGEGRRDVVVIAGKGHETEQVIGDARLPFDDAAEARRALG